MDPAECRGLILFVMRRAFVSRPCEEVPLVEVAAGAQVSEVPVHKYLAGKADLYAQVLRRTAGELIEHTRQIDDALLPSSSTRGRMRTSILIYLDPIAERSPDWVIYRTLAGRDPGDEAARIRRQAREAAVMALVKVIDGNRGHRDDFTLWDYLGFLDDACLRQVHAGCPDDQRHSLVDAALGYLEGVLGDRRA